MYPLGNPWKKSSQLLFDPKDRSKTPKEAFKESFNEMIDTLTQMGVQVWVMKDVPLQKIEVAKVFATAMRFHLSTEGMGVSLSNHRRSQSFPNSVIDSVKNENVHILDPLPYFLTKDNRCSVGEDYKPYYKDRDHVCVYGAYRLKPLFEPLFKKMAKSLREKRDPSKKDSIRKRSK